MQLIETRKMLDGEAYDPRELHRELAAFAGREIDTGGESDFGYAVCRLVEAARSPEGAADGGR